MRPNTTEIDPRLSPSGQQKINEIGAERAKKRGEVYESIKQTVENVLAVRTRRQRVKPVVKKSRPLETGIGGSSPSRKIPDTLRGGLSDPRTTEKVPVGEVTSVTTLDIDVDELRDELIDAVLEEVDHVG